MKFNKRTQNKMVTRNLAGGKAYQLPKELELATLVLTSFLKDQFYRSETTTLEKIEELLDSVDPLFAAKLAVYARRQYGMRSISHVLAGEIGRRVSGAPWAKGFFNKVVYRPDDILEILAFYLGKYGKPIPAAMKKGFSFAINKFSRYELAKYRGESKDIKMVDVFNLIHPRPVSEENKKIFKDLMTGKLKNEDTWETKLSASGKNKEETALLKEKAWFKLLSENKLGYFAALRNICNIVEQSPESIDLLCALLTNERKIKESLVLPFRFVTAYNEVANRLATPPRKIIKALNTAIEISLNNCPVFEGKTLVALDASGSMAGQPWEIGSLFAAVFAKKNDCDVMIFSEKAKYVSVNPGDTIFGIKKAFHFTDGGTDFNIIFKTADKKYDRIIILSDMSAWIGGGAPTASCSYYKTKYDADPFLYSFDLQGYGTSQFPNSKLFTLAGFSEKTFDIMKLMETDKNVLLTEIKKTEL